MAESNPVESTRHALSSALRSPMPHNELTEYGVLVSLVANEGRRWDELGVLVSEEDFFDPNHHIIMSELNRLAQAGEKITAYTVGTRIAERHGVEHPAVGIAVELDTERTLTDPHELIKQLKNYSLRRSLISCLAVATQKAYDVTEQHPGLIIEDVVQAITDVATDLSTLEELQKHAMPLLLAPIREELAYLKENGSPRNYLKTKFDNLDELTWGGLRPGHLYVLAGRPGTGKTSLALNFCNNMIFNRTFDDTKDEPLTIAFFSLEQTRDEIATKLLSAMSSVEYGRFKTGYLTAEDEMKIEQACSNVEQFCENFLVLNPTGLTITDFIHAVKHIKRTYKKLDFAVVDYIGLMGPTSPSQYKSRSAEIAEITRGMKLLANQEEVPILALAQVNRNPEARASARPRLSDLRDSGAIEQDADFVMFLYREDKPVVEQEYNKVELIVAKNRHGGVKTINLDFDEKITVFTEHDQQSEPLPDTPIY